MESGVRPGDETKPAQDRVGANLARLMTDGRLTTEELAARSGLDQDAIRLILLGEDRDLDVTTVVILAGAAGAGIGDLIAGIAWVPHGDRPGGEFRIDASA